MVSLIKFGSKVYYSGLIDFKNTVFVYEFSGVR